MRRWVVAAFLLTPVLAWAQLDLSKAKPLKVKGEQEGIIKLELPKTAQKLTPFVLFVRPNGADFDVIARGKVETVQGDSVLVSLDRTSISKFPVPGDLAVSLGTPKDWPNDTDPMILQPPVQAEAADLDPEPGYIEFGEGMIFGKLNTSASDGRTDEYKDIGHYRPRSIHFTWYLEFLWHFGLEYENWAGKFPTSTYYHTFGDSTGQLTTFALNYRFRPKWLEKKLRPTIRVTRMASSFSTLNPDEALISSDLQATGIGGRLSYEEVPPTWKPDFGSGATFQQVFLDLNYYLDMNVQDGSTISRGTSSSGSQMYDYKLGAQFILYGKWIPLIKRYVVEVGYADRVSKFKFSGPTRSEANGGYPVPQGTSGVENLNWYYVSLSVRFEDVIGQILKPR